MCNRGIVLIIGIFSIIFIVLPTIGENLFATPRIVTSDTPLDPNAVRIGGHYINMPLERLVIIRDDHYNRVYGAVKFVKFDEWDSGEPRFAKYEAWYQDDGTGNFSNINVKFNKGEASFILCGIFRLQFQFGNREVKCGIFRLSWWKNGFLGFYAPENVNNRYDYGIELAPTKWTDIKDVNVFDPRLKWYRYDEHRCYIDMPIDELW